MTQDQTQILNLLDKLNNPWIFTGFMLLVFWDIAWRGVSLWKAVKNNSVPWFVALLILNTMGILPIIYIFFFSKPKQTQV